MAASNGAIRAIAHAPLVPRDCGQSIVERVVVRGRVAMSRWRWLLFVALSRLESSEQTYMKLPSETTTTVARRVALHPRK